MPISSTTPLFAGPAGSYTVHIEVAKLSAGVVGLAITMVVAAAAPGRTAPDRTRPDAADHTTLITLRNGVRGDARAMLARIGSCERRAPDPYGAGRNAFNQCISPLLNEDLYKSRFEPEMLVGVLRDLASGPCLGLASGLLTAISQLGGEAETWFGDAESSDPSAGALERADAHDMHEIARSILKLTAARGWRTACRARPYQPSEHHLVHLAEVFTA